MIGIAGYLWSHAPWRTPPRQTAAVSDRVDLAQQPFVSAPNHEPPSGSQPMKMGSSTSVPVPAAAADTAAMPGIAATSQPLRQATAAEIAMMMKQGELFMENGDISGARLVFQRAAEAGDGAAALALAETYDPLVLGKSSTKAGIISDVAIARSWYQRAVELGSTAARERIARLAEFGE
jgi:TPR repeat protein